MLDHRPTDPLADIDDAPEDRAARPSRLMPFLVFGAMSALLFGVTQRTLHDDDPLVAAVGAYCCLAACLSGVAAAIFGTVTLSRALRARAADGRR